ncbi:unnamed protein product [Arctogadus glacialis]
MTSCSGLTRFSITTKKLNLALDNSMAVIAQTPASSPGALADASSATFTSSDNATAAAEHWTDDDDMETEKEDEEAGTGTDTTEGLPENWGLNHWKEEGKKILAVHRQGWPWIHCMLGSKYTLAYREKDRRTFVGCLDQWDSE